MTPESTLTSNVTSSTIDGLCNGNPRISGFCDFRHEIIIDNGIFRYGKDIVDLSTGLI